MKKLLSVCFLVMFVVGTDTFLVSPLLPLLQMQFHVPDAIAGWMVGAYALGYAVLALTAGPLSDGWNRKWVMVTGVIAFALATFFCSLADGFWSMVLWRFMAGASAAILAPQVWAAIATLLPSDKVVRGMGIATAGLALSQALGVPLGSVLAEVHWQTPFRFLAVASLALTMFILWWVPSLPASRAATGESLFGRYRQVFSNAQAKNAFLAYFMFQLGNFGRFSLMGLWVSKRFELSVSEIGVIMLWFGLGNVVGSLIGPIVVQRVGSLRTIVWGLLATALLSLLIPFLWRVSLVEAAWLMTSAVFGMMFPLMMSGLQSLAPGARGTIASLSNASMYGGATIGSAIAGLVYAHAGGFIAVSVMTAACFVFATWGFAALYPSTHPVVRTAST